MNAEMRLAAKTMDCDYCGLTIHDTTPDRFPFCFKCRAPLCRAPERDCGYWHYKARHDQARTIEDVKPI